MVKYASNKRRGASKVRKAPNRASSKVDKSTAVYPMYRQPGIGPQSIRRKLKLFFEEILAGQTVAGTAEGSKMIANSAYNPTGGAPGFQPRGFDQYMALYSFNTVVGSKLKMTVVTPATSTGALMFGMSVLEDATIKTNPRNYIELPRTKWAIANIDNNASNSIKTLEISYNTATFWQVKNPVDEYDLRGNDSSGPSRKAYIHTWFYNAIDATAYTTHTIHYEMELDVIFTGLRDVTAS